MDAPKQTFPSILQPNPARDIIKQNKGYAICPVCRTGKLVFVRSDTEAINLQLYCRVCKRELIVDIREGQCFKSQGR